MSGLGTWPTVTGMNGSEVNMAALACTADYITTSLETRIPDPQPHQIVLCVLQFTFNNVLLSYWATDCSAAAQRTYVFQLRLAFGNDSVGLYNDDQNTFYLVGFHEYNLPVQNYTTKQAVGQAHLIATNVSGTCLVDAFNQTSIVPAGARPDHPSTNSQLDVHLCQATNPANLHFAGTDSISSVQFWVWIIIGVGAAAVLGLSLATFIICRRSKRNRQLDEQAKREVRVESFAYVLMSMMSTDSDVGGLLHVQEGIDNVSGSEGRCETTLGLSSALRVRYGNLEGVEIGEIIGRGAFGRVYKGEAFGT